jgi:hypothetical protein
MVAGMAPSALAFGAGGEFRSPMAIAIIGGLLVSTFLSLLFVPAFFTIMDDTGRLFSRLFGRLLAGSDNPSTKHVTIPSPASMPEPAGDLAQSEARFSADGKC